MGHFVVFHKRVVFTGMNMLIENVHIYMEIKKPLCTSYTKRGKNVYIQL